MGLIEILFDPIVLVVWSPLKNLIAQDLFLEFLSLVLLDLAVFDLLFLHELLLLELQVA